MSRDWDPETDQFPTGGDEGDVERPEGDDSDEPIPVPPTDVPPAPVEEPPDAPYAPDDPDPEPIGDPKPNEPTRIV